MNYEDLLGIQAAIIFSYSLSIYEQTVQNTTGLWQDKNTNTLVCTTISCDWSMYDNISLGETRKIKFNFVFLTCDRKTP